MGLTVTDLDRRTRRFDIVTLFPDMFGALTGNGISRRALARGLYALTCWNPRDFTTDVHRTVDDRPYGGGPGMVMLASPLEEAIAAAIILTACLMNERPEAELLLIAPTMTIAKI